MTDPLSVAASVGGLLSLGIQVSQGLVAYYSSYAHRNEDVARTSRSLEGLCRSLQGLVETLKRRKFRSEETVLVDQITKSVDDCKEAISELEAENNRFRTEHTPGLRAATKQAIRKVAYPFKESTLAKLREAVSDIRDSISLAIDILNLKSAGELQTGVADVSDLLALVRASQISSEIQQWLKAPDPTTNHNAACEQHHPRTGLWFVKGQQFSDWLEQDDSFLWLSGFAGCGKTVLSSTIIQHTFRHRRTDARIGIGIFYFDFKDVTKQNASGFLASLLLQLANQLSDEFSYLNDLHSRYKPAAPPTPLLLLALREVILRFQDVYVIVDAIDESPRGNSRENVLRTLSDMRSWKLPHLHLMVTSRDELDIRRTMNPSVQEEVQIRNDSVDRDIAQYVSERLRTHPKFKKWSANYAEIEKALTERAHGMYVHFSRTLLRLLSRYRTVEEDIITPLSCGGTPKRFALS